jgi:hypothetical protein
MILISAKHSSQTECRSGAGSTIASHSWGLRLTFWPEDQVPWGFCARSQPLHANTGTVSQIRLHVLPHPKHSTTQHYEVWDTDSLLLLYSHSPSYGSLTYGHFELLPFPKVVVLASEFQLLVSLLSVCLQTRFALHLFALLCYTLWLSEY